MAVLQSCIILLVLQCFPVYSSDILIASIPNLMRVGNTETVLVTIQKDINRNPNRTFPVTVRLKNADDSVIDELHINVGVENARVNSEIAPMFVNPERIPSIENGIDASRYITVSVICDSLDFNQDKQVLLSLDGGFFFIQTDKPIYTPKQTVRIRLISLDQLLVPHLQPVRLDIRTPQDIVIYRENFEKKDGNRLGLYLHTFQFPEAPMFGNWSIVGYYGKDLGFNKSIQFEVKEYVLPTFNVEIDAPDYLLKTNRSIQVKVKAKYVYDKHVQGRSVLKVVLFDPDGEIEMKVTDYESLLGGIATHIIPTDKLGENWFDEYLGRTLYLEATVVEEVTGHFENASDVSVKIVSSPYVFSRDRTMNYFKPGLPFRVQTDLTFANGQPAAGVPVRVVAKGQVNNGEVNLRESAESVGDRDMTDNTDRNGQVNFNLYVPSGCRRITIELSTVVDELRRDEIADNNARLSFNITPYESPENGNEYLVIRLPNQKTRMRSSFNLDIFPERTSADSPIHVYILARGKIVFKTSKLHVGTVGGIDISVTPEMIPSARIVAFFVGEQNRIIADSVKMEVQQECVNDISVRFTDKNGNTRERFSPNDELSLEITAHPGTNVSLLAVDKAVLLLRDFHRLTRDKMYSTMDSHDTGCGPGGGRNSELVFKNAGVTVMVSSGPLDVGLREGFFCQSTRESRRRRSIENFRDRYNGNERKMFACNRGNRRLGTGTCEEKSRRFERFINETKYRGINETELEELRDIFITCCQDAESDSRERSIDLFDFGNFEHIRDDVLDDVSVRKDFSESWAFDTHVIDSSSTASVRYTLPGSITTWKVQAFGLNNGLPMCVMEPKELIVSSELFIQLKMPYSVIRNEYVEIQATVFNYHPERRAVRIFWQTPPQVCSGSSSRGEDITVEANDAKTVTYVVIGVEIGEWPITVIINTPSGSDGVQKKLNVVAEGVEREFHHSIVLNPQGAQLSRRRRDVRIGQDCVWDEGSQSQVDCLDISLPPTVVPGSESCYISMTGTPLGPAITSVVTGLDKWITLPRYCGEQTMIRLAPNVYVLQYLRDTETGSEDIHRKALEFIHSDLPGEYCDHRAEEMVVKYRILHEITYRHDDGSFAAFLNRPSSTWLTAFVAKVFCQAAKLTNVDPAISCGAIRWIVQNRQRDNGVFYEGKAVIHKEMTGGISGDIAMTAYALVALSECSCDDVVPTLPESKREAKEFLELQLDHIQRPYLLAVVTYALALSNSTRKVEANNLLKSFATEDLATGSRAWGEDVQQHGSQQPFWNHRRPSALSVETTGYALLAQIMLREIDYAKGIAIWLSTQQNYGGGFVSTQDTVIALQALSYFSSVNIGGDLDLQCNMTTAKGFQEILWLRNEDLLLQKMTKVPKEYIQQKLVVKTHGNGTGVLNVEVRYNDENSDPIEQCPFAMEIETRRMNQRQPVQDVIYQIDDVLRITVDVSYLRATNTSMAIVDVGLFTGFEPDIDSCERTLRKNPTIARYEQSSRSVVFYIDYIPIQREGSLRFSFNATCRFNVSNVHHAAVKVYDYYNPGEECTQFYEGEGSNVVRTLCEDDTCTCVSSECPPCEDTMDSDQLLEAACASEHTYVYKLAVTSIQVKDGYQVLNTTIKDVIKAGDEQSGIDIAAGDMREFWVSNACRCPNVKLREYLVIGSNTLRYSIPGGENGVVEGYRYVIDSNVFMKRWRRKLEREVRRPIVDGHSRCR